MDPQPRPELPLGALDGGRFERRKLLRGMLRAAAGASLAASVPAALAGCSDLYTPVDRFPAPKGYPIITDVLPPGLERLVLERATRLGVTAGFLASALAGTRDAAFTAATQRSGPFDPITDRFPRAADLAVVQVSTSLTAYARSAIGQGVKVVTYLAPLPYQTAEIAVDASALGALLASDAAAWARGRRRGRVNALFVSGPPVDLAAQGPLARSAPAVSAAIAGQAIGATLGRLLPSLRLTTVEVLADPVGAVNVDPGLLIVLCANDLDALELAQGMRAQIPAARRRDLYVGGLGTPSIGQSGTPSGQGAGVEPWVRELDRGDVLRALATVRLRDLADALVDLPATLERGGRPYDIRLPPELLRPRSAALNAYARDSAG